METTARFVLIAKRILRELAELSDSVRMGFLGVQKRIEAIAKQQEAENNQEKIQPPFVRAEVQSPIPIQRQKDARETRQQRRDRIKVGIEIATFISVFAYAIINYKMLREMRTANATAYSQFTFSIRQANAANENSQRVLNTTIDQFHLDQRAWLGVTDISIKNVVVPGRRFVWIGYIQNTGKTPALNTTTLFKFKTFLKDASPKFAYDNLTNEPQGKMAIPPSAKFSIAGHENPQDAPLTELQIGALQEGITRMYIYGKIEYDDVFKIRHHTHICAWLDKDLATTHPCQTYNDAD